MTLPNWAETSFLLGWPCFQRPLLRLIIRVGMHTTLHAGCVNFPVVVGMMLCAQLPLPGVCQLCLVFDYGFDICFLGNFYSYGGHADLCGDDGLYPIREGER